jgi:hypothetical protein
MQDQRSRDVANDEAQTDVAVLALLVDGDAQRLWSVEEVAREIGDGARDALARLHGAGLVHRLEGFVFAARAALRGARLMS